ncbi:aspartate:alanine exchanger family transporter [Prosthecomicrobium sp. N25]|uniref:aspartate:alanine exchanger family transporter n=1 Tax=Prosthecomicrobium sp. N25 TaxID=3129254 RepID=UPI003077A4D2
MAMLQTVIAKAPEVFLLLSIALGTVLGKVRIKGFAIGGTASILLVSVILGQFGEFVIPGILKSILFGMFVFTIGYRSGPEFFASLNVRTLGQVALAVVIGGTGLIAVLATAYLLKLDAGTASGLAAGALTQSSVIGTASGALQELGLDAAALKTAQGNVAAGYAVTYITGYILVLVFVPYLAPRLMGVDLKAAAEKLEETLASGGEKQSGANLLYRKFQARSHQATKGAGQTVAEIEARIGRRSVVERILRKGEDVEPLPDTVLQLDDEVLVAGPTAAILHADTIVGPETDGEEIMRKVPGEAKEVLVENPDLHGLTLQQIVDRFGSELRGIFLRSLSRRGLDVPITPETRIYVGDVMTVVGHGRDMSRIVPMVGEALASGDRADIAYLAGGLAVGLAVGLLSIAVGSVPLTLGGGGGALVAGLVCGWLRSRKPIIGNIPPAAQQTLIDIGLGGFIAAIGLANGPAAVQAIQANGVALVFAGFFVTLVPMVIGTLFAHRVLKMNPVVICGALAGAMTVDAAVTGACEVAESQTPVLGVAVPYAVANVFLTMLGPIIVATLS